MARILFFLCLAGASAQTRTLGVCEALNSSIVREEVAIQGSFAFGVHGGGFLEGTEGEPCPGWRKRFFTAPAFIGVEFFSALGVRLTTQQEQRNFEFLKRLHPLSGVAFSRSSFTIRGILVKKFWPIIFRSWDGQYFGKALGPNGGMLAELIINEPPSVL